jgi:hypothetical protein
LLSQRNRSGERKVSEPRRTFARQDEVQVKATRSRSPSLRSVANALTFALACQQVIALRMFRVAFGGSRSRRETTRMVAEKAAAAARAQLAAAAALPTRGPKGAASAAAAVYRKAVRANRRRLSRG